MKKFFTRKGDDGTTGLLGEGRVFKSDARMEALGSLDEASASLGLARSLMKSPGSSELVVHLQRDLYHLMAEVASTPETEQKFRAVDEAKVKWLEEQTEEIGRKIELPNEFILPGDNPGAAALSLARTVVRRAERRIVQLFMDGQYKNQFGIAYLNRLSSLCFVLEVNEVQSGCGTNPTLAKGK